MKIRNRLTWALSFTALVAIATLGLLVYYFTADFHEREFFARLEERVALTELIFLERDREIEQVLRDKFLQTLDSEEEYAISLTPSGIDSLNRMFPAGFAEKIQQKETVRFWQGNRQGVGKHYYLPNGEFAVIVTAVDVFGRTKLDYLRRILLIGGFVAVLLLVAVGRFGFARALRPLENKIQHARRISADRFDLRLQVKNPNDEIGELATAFNRMLDRLQNAFEAQRQFVRNASHEMRNPLTAISGEAEVLLQKNRSPEEYREALRIIQLEADRLQALIQQLLNLEKTEALSDLPDPQWFALDQCLLESTETFAPGRLQLNIDLEEGDHNLFGNPHLVQIALQNLLDNALKYSDDKLVTVSLSRLDHQYQILIADQGIGIPESDLQNIFEPFFRSANALGRQGQGIGLALVKKIISLHQGSLRVSSMPGSGTTVEITLPAD